MDMMLQRKSFTETAMGIYNQIKSQDNRHGGFWFLTKPFYMPIDLEIVKSILLKDFDHFTDHGSYYNEKIEPLTANLLNLEGARWKTLRTKLTPVFTSSKMKNMFHTMVDCTDGLRTLLEKEASKQRPVEIKTILARFTTDIIGSCAFGLDCNCMQNPDSDFEKHGKLVFHRSFFENISAFLCNTLPKQLVTTLGLLSINPNVSRFFTDIVRKTIQHRETNNVKRNDFVELLLQIKHQKSDDLKQETTNSITDEEFAAQCFIFFVAGFETSSTLMTFALLELAKEENRSIQENLREEIYTVLKKHGNQLTYDAVMEMTYLDKVVHETLRLHPPIAVTQRICTKNYQIPETDITLEKGVRLWIPVVGIHMNPEYYPNPEKFNPEHFNEENKSSRPACTFLPFGEGPRICIGARFGLMQSKLGLITMIRSYNVSLNEKTRTPIKLSPKIFIAEVDGEVWLNISKIKM